MGLYRGGGGGGEKQNKPEVGFTSSNAVVYQTKIVQSKQLMLTQFTFNSSRINTSYPLPLKVKVKITVFMNEGWGPGLIPGQSHQPAGDMHEIPQLGGQSGSTAVYRHNLLYTTYSFTAE
jgi:hypothetical protein